MLNETKLQVINLKTVASGWLIYLNCMMMHGPANVKVPLLPCIRHYFQQQIVQTIPELFLRQE